MVFYYFARNRSFTLSDCGCCLEDPAMGGGGFSKRGLVKIADARPNLHRSGIAALR